MKNIYAMRRANGDWFGVEAHERLRVPLFHSSHDAMMARLRNFGMLLFHPVALDAGLLTQIATLGGGTHVDFSMMTDPFASPTRGKPLEQAELELLLPNLVERASVSFNGNRFPNPGISKHQQSEWWN